MPTSIVSSRPVAQFSPRAFDMRTVFVVVLFTAIFVAALFSGFTHPEVAIDSIGL